MKRAVAIVIEITSSVNFILSNNFRVV